MNKRVDINNKPSRFLRRAFPAKETEGRYRKTMDDDQYDKALDRRTRQMKILSGAPADLRAAAETDDADPDAWDEADAGDDTPPARALAELARSDFEETEAQDWIDEEHEVQQMLGADARSLAD